MALNEFINGSVNNDSGFPPTGRLAGCLTVSAEDPYSENPFTILDCYSWDLMQNGGRLFEEDGYRAGKNITRRQVWNNYPNGPAPWTEWDSDLYLNQFK